MCLMRVLRRFPDTCASIKHHVCTVPYESAVRTWILDDRIRSEIEWTPVLPGKNWYCEFGLKIRHSDSDYESMSESDNKSMCDNKSMSK